MNIITGKVNAQEGTLTASISIDKGLTASISSDKGLAGQLGNEEQEGRLTASISSDKGLAGQLGNEEQLVGSITIPPAAGASPYTGEYEVTPTVEGLNLPTRQKYMTDDVKILAIPYFEVSNTSGGNTIYIAREIEKE